MSIFLKYYYKKRIGVMHCTATFQEDDPTSLVTLLYLPKSLTFPLFNGVCRHNLNPLYIHWLNFPLIIIFNK